MYYVKMSDDAAKAAARTMRAWTEAWSAWTGLATTGAHSQARAFSTAMTPTGWMEMWTTGANPWSGEAANRILAAWTESMAATSSALSAMASPTAISLERNPFGVSGLFSPMHARDDAAETDEKSTLAAAQGPVAAAAAAITKARDRATLAVEPVADTATTPDGEPDDLTMIKGVGPKMRDALHEHGIFHFWQIAQLSGAEIDALEDKLKFKGRIERDGWVEQAKELAAVS